MVAPHNKQLERIVTRYRGDVASAPFHDALRRASRSSARPLNCGGIRARTIGTPLAHGKGILDSYGNAKFSRDVIDAVLTEVTQGAAVHEAKQGKKREGDSGDPPNEE